VVLDVEHRVRTSPILHHPSILQHCGIFQPLLAESPDPDPVGMAEKVVRIRALDAAHEVPNTPPT